jgi:hypothetical protein
MPKSKQQPVKRKYTKKGTRNSIQNLEWVDPKPKPEDKDMEIAELTQICSIFTKWTADQSSSRE